MAERHQHRHGGLARSTAQPYASTGRSHAPDRVAYRAGAHESQHRAASNFNGQPPSHSATSASGAVDDVAAQPVRSAEQPRSYNSFQSKVQQAAKQTGATSASKKQKKLEDGGGLDDEEAELDLSKPVVYETDVHRLEQRQKQIDMGKSTSGYKHYLRTVPKYKRDYEKRFTEHPLTPRKQIVCSKRSWDGQVRKWRRMLHIYDSPEDSTAGAGSSEPVDNEDMQDTEGATVQNSSHTMTTPIAASRNQLPELVSTSAAPSAKFDSSHFAAAKSPPSASRNPSESASQPAPGGVASFPSFTPSQNAPAKQAAQPMVDAMNFHSVSTASARVPPATAPLSAFATATHPHPVLFTSSTPQKAAVFEDSLASFDEEDLDLMPPSDPSTSAAAATAAHLMDDEELVDYEEDGESAEEMEMRQQALAAARAL